MSGRLLSYGAAVACTVALGVLVACAHAAPRSSPCEARAATCPGSISVCASDGETACLVQRDDEGDE